MPYYLPIAEYGEIDGFMPFPKALAWNETQIVLSMILTQAPNSISYNNNHYIKLAS